MRKLYCRIPPGVLVAEPWLESHLCTTYHMWANHLEMCFCSDDARCDNCDEERINCTVCKEGLFLDRFGFCSPCKDPLCERCSSANRCLKCKAADFNADNQPLLYLSRERQCKIW